MKKPNKIIFVCSCGFKREIHTDMKKVKYSRKCPACRKPLGSTIKALVDAPEQSEGKL